MPIEDPSPTGLTTRPLHQAIHNPDLLSFITSAPSYITKALSSSVTTCSISRVLPIFCNESSPDDTHHVEMTNKKQTVEGCTDGFEGWVCLIMAYGALIMLISLILTALLLLEAYSWTWSVAELCQMPQDADYIIAQDTNENVTAYT